MQSFDYDPHGGLVFAPAGKNRYKAMIEQGVHRLDADGVEIDFLSQDLHLASDRKTILVCLGGALKDRAQLRGPFFSGARVAKLLNLPLISISDPTLEICPDLLLSWYMGTAKHPHLPQTIATHLDRLADEFQSRLIFFGGSGGGFSILNVQSKMQVSSNSVIWNPQTLISNYIPQVVNAYARDAFGYSKTIDGPETAELFFSTSGVCHDVTRVGMNGGTCLYLQNASDRHVERHMKPLMSHGEWTEVSSGVFHSAERGITTAIASWGKKHAVLPRASLIKALQATIDGMSAVEIARLVQNDYPDTTKL